MRKWLFCAFVLSLGAFMPLADAGKKDSDPKESLQALQEFIGSWKGTANDKKLGFWSENASWSWRFKGKDVWMTFDLEKSKLYKGGEVRFLPDKSKFQITVTDKAGKKAVYEGEIKKSVLIVERLNPDTSDTEQFKINITGGGDRLSSELWIKPDGRTMFSKQLQVVYTREGVTFGVDSAGKKPVCVVTGGLGTSTVSYMGVTYYVCCTGCRDAFNDNPEKFIKEYEAKKNKK
jgi:hypothetical protein